MKENAENQHQKALLGQLSELPVGGIITVSVSRASYLRAICSTYGLQWDKKFQVKTDREARTITATRLA